MKTECPLEGTEHFKSCALTETAHECCFKQTCKEMLEDEQRRKDVQEEETTRV